MQNNLTKSWTFLKEMSVVGFRYSETIVFEIDSNFIYDRISRLWMFLKTGLQTYNVIKKRSQYRCFSVKLAKFLRTPYLQNTSGGCFCYDSETYSMAKIYLSLDSSFFLI